MSCKTTHYQGCECHEANWKSQLTVVQGELEQERRLRLEEQKTFTQLRLRLEHDHIKWSDEVIEASARLNTQWVDNWERDHREWLVKEKDLRVRYELALRIISNPLDQIKKPTEPVVFYQKIAREALQPSGGDKNGC